MNNVMISAKRIITNKNTVTILGVLAVLVILYYTYQKTIDNAVKPVQVPVASHTIEPQTEVTDADIAWISVPSISKRGDVLMKKTDIVGKYTGVNATIPEGSMFYKNVLVEKEDLPGTWLTLLKSDVNGNIDIPYYVNVNIVTTFGNSIQPNDYIDIYMRAKDESDLVMFGKLIDNIEILAVKSSTGEDVFKSTENVGTPAYLYFGVPSELHDLLRKASYMSSLGIELVVVPHGGVNPITGDIEVSSEYLRDFIDANSAQIPSNEEWLEQIDENGNVLDQDNQ